MGASHINPMAHWFALQCGAVAAWFAGYVQSVSANKRLRRALVMMGIVAVIGIGGTAIGQQYNPMGNYTGITEPDPASLATNRPASSWTTTKIITSIGNAVDGKLQSLSNNSALKSASERMAGFFVLAMMVWTGIKVLISGKGISELLGEWVPIWFAYAIVTLLTDVAVANQIVQTLNNVASAIAPNVRTDTVTNMLGSVGTKIMTSVSAVSGMDYNSDAGWGGVAFVAMAIAGIMKLCTVVVIMLAGCVYIAIAAMAMISTSLVLALGAIMVPFLIFSPMSWLFDSWLRFLLGACMMKVVGAFMLNLTSELLDLMVSIARDIKAESPTGFDGVTPDLVIYGALLLMSVVAALLMAQTPTIATGLLQGSAGGAGFKGIGGVTNAAGSRMASSAGSSAASQSYNHTAGRLLAANKGYSDAKNGVSAKAQKYGNAEQHRAYVTSYDRAKASSKPPAPPPGAAP